MKRMKSKKSFLIYLFLYFFLYLFLCPIHAAFSFDYFNNEIDYWNQKKSIDSTPAITLQKNNSKNTQKFDWDRYLNPKTKEDLKEIFREGDYVPPTPLLEVAQNPTHKNIENWLEVIRRKNELMSRLHKKMSIYIEKNKSLKAEELSILKGKQRRLKPLKLDVKRFRFRMYFESNCAHCKRMMDTMLDLKNMGFFVELRQIDDNQEYSKNLPFVVMKASKKELQSKNITAWPVLFVGDSQKKLIYRIGGYQSTESILSALNKK